MTFFPIVSGQMSIIQKEMGIMKVDIIKNQELLTDIINKSRNQVTEARVTEEFSNRSILKMPIMTIDDFNFLEANEEQKKILVCSFLLVFTFNILNFFKFLIGSYNT